MRFWTNLFSLLKQTQSLFLPAQLPQQLCKIQEGPRIRCLLPDAFTNGGPVESYRRVLKIEPLPAHGQIGHGCKMIRGQL